MISCRQIRKTFGQQVVLDDFSFDFNSVGFYLLLGESGSGKTTFLNILAGLLPFDEGRITIGKDEFTEIVDTSVLDYEIDYLTQDAFFVDFLSVMDNMRLISSDDGEITDTLAQFGLGDKIEQMPTTLSGGEKQRLAIVRTIIRGKRVLLLDEPTAALDSDNKNDVFKLLSSLKRDVLIICASHDPAAENYADEVIRFGKEAGTEDSSASEDLSKPIALSSSKSSHVNQKLEGCRGTSCSKRTSGKSSEKSGCRKIDPFLKRWLSAGSRDRTAIFLFTFFLSLALVLCFLADFPEHKLDISIKNLYRTNALIVDTHYKHKWSDLELLEDTIREIVLDYRPPLMQANLSQDDDPNTVTDEFHENLDYEGLLYVLPFDQENFKLLDSIKFGSYFTDERQVILSSEMASALSPEAPEKLIGDHLKKTIYGLGTVELEIVGIFDKLNRFEREYMRIFEAYAARNYIEENYSDLFFVNAKITSHFEDDERFFSGEQRRYFLFFESYHDVKAYADLCAERFTDHNKKFTDIGQEIYIRQLGIFWTFFYVMIPLAVFMIIFSTLLYVMLKRTEFVHSSRFIAVFEYSGYSKTLVLRRLTRLHIIELLKTLVLSLAFAFLLTGLFNFANKQLALVSFQVFTYNGRIIIPLLLMFLIISILAVKILFQRVKMLSWYDHLVRTRDLL